MEAAAHDSEGMELMLRQVPNAISAKELYDSLALSLPQLNHAFTVVLQQSAEQRFWRALEPEWSGHTATARIIVPNAPDGSNAAAALVNRMLRIPHQDSDLVLKAVPVENPTTTNAMYADLMRATAAPEYRERLWDGAVGSVHSVSCGFLIGRGVRMTFETAHSWTFPKGETGQFLFLGDARPPRFRVCLPAYEAVKKKARFQWSWLLGSNTEDGDPPASAEAPRQPALEWMDFHETNIQAVILDNKPDAARLVVYFVLEKPPQFYRAYGNPRPQDVAAGDHRERGFTKHRTPYPSSVLGNDKLDVCGIPWAMQYSRVYRVEYSAVQRLTTRRLWDRLVMRRLQPVSYVEQAIDRTDRPISDIEETIGRNLRLLATVFPPHFSAYRAAVAQLLYNNILLATAPETGDFIAKLADDRLPSSSWPYSQQLQAWSEKVGSCQMRAVRRCEAFKRLSASNQPSQYGVMSRKPRSFGFFDLSFYGVDDPEPFDAGKELDSIHKTRTFPLLSLCRLPEPAIGEPAVFETLVHPSHLEMHGPIDLPTNSVMDKYRNLAGRFMRVGFVDNNGKALRSDADADLGTIISGRVVPVLTGEIPLHSPLLQDLMGFEFLGYTMSSLKRKKAVWFFQRLDGLHAGTIRNQIGDWDFGRGANPKLANHPSKWGARISLAFTESIPVASLYPAEWRSRDDVVADRLFDFPNTDGCGIISPELCNEINQVLGKLGHSPAQTFQIRFGGVKGVVFAAPKSLLCEDGPAVKMLLRKSQVKFRVSDASRLQLRVVSSAAECHQSLFTVSALKAFEDSGADTDVIEAIFDEVYAALTVPSARGLTLLQQMLRIPSDHSGVKMNSRHGFLKLALRLLQDGIPPETYHGSFLALYLAELATKTRDKSPFGIPIPGSWNVLGITDDYHVLGPGEVLVRANSEAKEVSGPVLIYRDPIIHIGDIQQATAISKEELKQRFKAQGKTDYAERLSAMLGMRGVIFFSQKDSPPFPNLLSGGDLDGDRFDILTTDCGFWGGAYRTSDHKDYVNEGSPPYGGEEEEEGDKSGAIDADAETGVDPNPRPPTGYPDQMATPPTPAQPFSEPFAVKGICQFIGEYIRRDCFNELEQVNMALADQRANGLHDADVMNMSTLLSTAVDFPKSGQSVELARVLQDARFRARGKPDFLQRLGKWKATAAEGIYGSGIVYPSPHLLGRLFRKVEAVKFKSAPPGAKQYDDTARRAFVESIQRRWGPLVGQRPFPWSDMVADELKQFLHGVIIQRLNHMSSTPRADVLSRFLQKQPGDFPNSTLHDLVGLISAVLVRNHIVAWSDTGLRSVRPAEGSKVADVEATYRLLLFRAWEKLSKGFRLSNGMHYDSFEFLCLFALYCEPIPIDKL